jgi:hypothetical protein
VGRGRHGTATFGTMTLYTDWMCLRCPTSARYMLIHVRPGCAPVRRGHVLPDVLPSAPTSCLPLLSQANGVTHPRASSLERSPALCCSNIASTWSSCLKGSTSVDLRYAGRAVFPADMFVAQQVAVPVGVGRSALSVPPHPVVPQHKVHKVSSSYQHPFCSCVSFNNILRGHGGFSRSMHLQNRCKSPCYCCCKHATQLSCTFRCHL